MNSSDSVLMMQDKVFSLSVSILQVNKKEESLKCLLHTTGSVLTYNIILLISSYLTEDVHVLVLLVKSSNTSWLLLICATC